MTWSRVEISIFHEKWYTGNVMEELKEIIATLKEKLPHLREYL